MGRKKLNKEWWAARLSKADVAKLNAIAIDLGYTVKRTVDQEERVLPGNTALMEAIARGDILLYKKVKTPIDDSK